MGSIGLESAFVKFVWKFNMHAGNHSFNKICMIRMCIHVVHKLVFLVHISRSMKTCH